MLTKNETGGLSVAEYAASRGPVPALDDGARSRYSMKELQHCDCGPLTIEIRRRRTHALGHPPVSHVVQALAGSGRANGGKDIGLYQRRAFEIAQGQLMPIFQTAFMLYMFVGNQLSLFSIFFLVSMGTAPIRNLFAIQQGGGGGAGRVRAGSVG